MSTRRRLSDEEIELAAEEYERTGSPTKAARVVSRSVASVHAALRRVGVIGDGGRRVRCKDCGADRMDGGDCFFC